MKISLHNKLLLDRFPVLYLGLLRLSRRCHWSREWIVGRDTEIVIEGFPRSGNSFALSAFKSANPQVKRIATHVHMASQVVRAAQLQVPCVMLIRQPLEAVCSLLALSVQLGDLPADTPDSSLGERLARLFDYYRLFHQRTWPVREAVLPAPFEVVTQDFGHVIDALNYHWRRSYKRFEHTDESVRAILQSAPAHMGPRQDRDQIKERIRALACSGNLHEQRDKAESIHRRWRDHADTFLK